jgi:hypothetical protein
VAVPVFGNRLLVGELGAKVRSVLPAAARFSTVSFRKRCIHATPGAIAMPWSMKLLSCFLAALLLLLQTGCTGKSLSAPEDNHRQSIKSMGRPERASGDAGGQAR